MKKNLSLLVALMVSVMCSANVFAADKYVSASIGISWPNDVKITEDKSDSFYVSENEFGSGVTFLGAYGNDFGDIRLETELGYQQNDLDRSLEFYGGSLDEDTEMNGDVSIISILGNIYYDIAVSDKVEIYLTAGAGVAFVNFNDIGDIDDDADRHYNVESTAFAYQLGAGVAIPVAENLVLDARYRYFGTEDFTIDDTAGWWNDTHVTELSSHSALIGLRMIL